MSDDTSGLPNEAVALLEEHVRSFEHLEVLLLLHREQLREWTANEVGDALATPTDLTAVLDDLARASLIAQRSDEMVPTYFYGPADSGLAEAIECLAHAYEHRRAAIIRTLNASVIARVRSRAAFVFAESFVVSAAPPAVTPATARPRRAISLFLDVDGTLLDIARRPDEVVVPQRLVSVLTRLYATLGGAMALVSGRPVSQLDRLFAPLQLPCAGVHGSEWRDCSGRMHAPALARREQLNVVRATLARFVAANPGLLLEDKGVSLAVHFRERPLLAASVERELQRALACAGDAFRIQDGALVRELVPCASTKGSSVETFLAEPAFAGRMPVFIGDDVTDLDGFAAVERHGGRAIAVGPRIGADTRLPRPSAVIEWLEFLVRAEGRFA